jgi:hypothetical protein
MSPRGKFGPARTRAEVFRGISGLEIRTSPFVNLPNRRQELLGKVALLLLVRFVDQQGSD